MLSPAQILERLSQRLDLFRGGRDAEARQQTLRATIAWSYDLLTEDEQRVLRSLSVFAGGCTLTAAEEVAGVDLDTLQSLVEKSLLRFSSERYWMLETIREYAVERLHDAPAASDVIERHARFYTQLSQSGHGELRGPAQEEWLERLERELENLRTAIRWTQEHDKSLEVELAGTSWSSSRCADFSTRRSVISDMRSRRPRRPLPLTATSCCTGARTWHSERATSRL